MATNRGMLPLLLVAIVLMGGVFIDGVNGHSSRREVLSAAPPPPTCPAYYCGDPADPNCCVNPGGGLFCTNFLTDIFNCGNCRSKCSPLGPCCHGVCVDFQIDPKNCGACDHHCGKHQKCVNSQCCHK